MRGHRVEQHGVLRAVAQTRQPDIRGLEVEMEGARPMRRPEPFADLRAHLQRSRRAHPTALPQLVSQGELASTLVDEEERLHQVHASPERPRDIRMVQLRDRGSERSAAVQARAHRAETVRLLFHASDSTSRVRAAQRRAGSMSPRFQRMNDVQSSYTCTPARLAACDMWARVADPPELPEQFAPTGPRPSHFRVVPSPPLRPTLLPDEARFALRLSVLSGCAEFAAWAWFAHAGDKGAVLGWAALRLLKPVWAWTGTRFPRSVVAFSLLLLALFGVAASLLTVGQLFTAALLAVALPAFGDLCASCAADGISVERRSAAFAWFDMAQGLGGATGVALGASFPRVAAILSVAALLAASIGVPDLQDRGTPRTNWTLAAHEHVLHSRFRS